MIPKGVASWEPMTQYMIELIRLLNTRTEAQATQDVKVHEHPGGAVNPPGLGNPEQAWQKAQVNFISIYEKNIQLSNQE